MILPRNYFMKPTPAHWPTNAIPGRTREELAAAGAASIIAPNAEAMRVELALERDRLRVASLKARAEYTK